MSLSHDLLGNPVSLSAPSSLGGVDDFVGGFLSCEARAVNLLLAPSVDPAPLPQAYAAALHMFAESADGPRNARPYIERALDSPIQATPQELRFVHAVAAWVNGDLPLAIQLHLEQAHECPRDLASLKLGQYHLFNRGDAPGMLKLALACENVAADVPYFHGMLAFAWEQCHFLDDAETSARHALSLSHKEPWAQHAIAHVMLTQGRLHEGLNFMQESSASWTGLNSFMCTHNWWHLAVFALELEQHDAVLRLYDDQVWGVEKAYSQDQIGAVSLLARLELAGIDVGKRWDELLPYLQNRTKDQFLPFLDMQYLYGLARCGTPKADELLQNIEHYSDSAMQTNDVWQQVWQRVCLPACRGLMAHAQGNFARAADQLGLALPRLAEIGGSHAQRDLFELFYLDALVRNGKLAGAQHLVQQRCLQQPESLRLKHQASRLYTDLGLNSLASRAWS